MNWNSNDTKYILKRFIIYVLICIAMFIIGTWKAKAISVSPTTSTIYCAYGQQSRIVDSETNYAGCANINRQSGYSLVTNTYGDLEINKNYDISGSFLAPYRNYGTISIKVNGTSCFITNVIYEDTQTQSSRVTYNYFCNNVGINNNKQFATVVQFTGVSTGLQINGLYSSDSINVEYHFDENNNTAAAINQNTQAVQDVNNSINNDNVTTSDADDFTSNQAFSDSSGLESVIQLPLNMVNSLTSTCQPIQVTIPFIDYTGEIPCMSTIYRSKFNSLYTIVKIVINGFFVYRLLLKVYELVHNAKQPDEDKLEVIEV